VRVKGNLSAFFSLEPLESSLQDRIILLKISVLSAFLYESEAPWLSKISMGEPVFSLKLFEGIGKSEKLW